MWAYPAFDVVVDDYLVVITATIFSDQPIGIYVSICTTILHLRALPKVA